MQTGLRAQSKQTIATGQDFLARLFYGDEAEYETFN